MSLSPFRSRSVSGETSTEAPIQQNSETPAVVPAEEWSDTAQPIASPLRKTPLRSAALHGAAPALLLLGLCLGVTGAQMPQPLQFATALPSAEVRSSILNGGVLPLSQTLLVEASQGGGSILWQGRLDREVSVVGRAPLAGQIARIMVNEGQFVNVNDRVLQISSGSVTRVPVRAERAQTRAERQQVAAYNAQEALQLRMSTARERLAQAQSRVERAHQRIEEAEQMIARLKRGETVADTSTQEASEPRRETPRREARRELAPQLVVNKAAERAAQGALERAQSQLAKAKQAADAADAESQNRAKELLSARAALDSAQKQLDVAKSAPAPKKTEVTEALGGEEKAELEASSNSGEISAAQSEVSAARSALSKAESAASVARRKARSAHSEVSAAQGEVTRAKSQLREASRPVQDSRPRRVEELPLFADNDEPAPRRETRRARPQGNLSVASAVRLVRSATRESAEATAEAERLRNEIEGYERQVRETREQFNESAQSLEAAQEQVMENTIRTNLSVVRAPTSGTVLWVAPLARDVGEGEAILTVGRNDVLTARFVDSSGLWKKMKEGDTLPAVISGDAPAKPAATPTPAPTARPRQDDALMGSPPGGAVMGSPPSSASGANTPSPAANDEPAPGTSPRLLGTPITAKIREIETPSQPGGKAIIEIAIFNPRQKMADGRRRRRFAPGMQIVCSAGAPGASGSINVPAAAVMRAGDNAGVIAVLVPKNNAQASTQQTDARQANVQTVSTGNMNEHRVEWRPVALGKTDGVQQEIKTGLRDGERIALQPSLLRAWANASGPNATLRLG